MQTEYDLIIIGAGAVAEAALQPELVRLAASEDARIGMEAFVTRQPATFVGR